ncbi:MAG: bifunctional 5,10-methylene-tetrahydrofolate dehydrogenase/5,10-methylene-tetrahydrofolate cyclohydrolase, partial [Synergistaceae bacterium]|nr:bifunctional 5,10-methylene-tetrahydrofolate dehydrogenase/5,10-methylene-tetrahydrofolate cyclohydrolase [Synergistaceae bacterium]
MAEILKGSPVATKLTEELTLRCESLKSKGITPTLATLRVGENPGDVSYESSAEKRCGKIGIAVRKIILPIDASPAEITANIRAINADSE